MSDMLPIDIWGQNTWELKIKWKTHNVPINKNLLGEVVRNILSRHRGWSPTELPTVTVTVIVSSARDEITRQYRHAFVTITRVTFHPIYTTS